MSMNQNDTPQWAIVELMGHIRTGARISLDPTFTTMIRADVPTADGFVTQIINPSSVYRITCCSEEIARACAKANQDAAMPLHSWELTETTRLPSESHSSQDLEESYAF